MLLIHFEDLKENPEHCIRHVAKFLGIPLSEEKFKLVMHRSTYNYMKEKSHLFDGRFEVQKVREVLGKIKPGKEGAATEQSIDIGVARLGGL